MKLCLVFPGIGYHVDKPLLYYSKRLAINMGYEIKEINYPVFEGEILRDQKNREEVIEQFLNSCSLQLKDIDYTKYDSILCLAKSIGTTVCMKYLNKNNLHAINILYTPIEQTLEYINDDCLVFTGTKDPWMEHSIYLKYSHAISHQTIYENVNHSLEQKDISINIEILNDVIKQTEQFILEKENV